MIFLSYFCIFLTSADLSPVLVKADNMERENGRLVFIQDQEKTISFDEEDVLYVIFAVK